MNIYIYIIYIYNFNNILGQIFIIGIINITLN